MIKFDQLVHAIHAAALAANQAVADENLKVINKYFESTTETKASDEFIDSAMQLTSELIEQQSQDTSELGNLMQQFADCKSAEKRPSDSFDFQKSGSLRPRTVTLQCPEATPHGTRMRNMKVPLIALSPITLSEISEIKFKTELEIVSDSDGLNVNFAKKTKAKDKASMGDDKNTITSLEITIRPKDTSDGLKDLIQGYEKVIKAQMP
tara:strand:- start:583 stop:1206 length:624 start_codon:yes stop_codon:yes gene_type:complete